MSVYEQIERFAIAKLHCGCCGAAPGSMCSWRSNRSGFRHRPHNIRINIAAKELTSQEALLPLSRQELERTARQQGTIYWTNSQIYERLYIGRKGDVMATRLLRATHHPISMKDIYYCILIAKNTPIRIGDMLK